MLSLSPPAFSHSYVVRPLAAVVAVALSAIAAVLPSMAAEEVTISTKLGSRSVDTPELEQYARTGEADGTLGYFIADLSSHQQDVLRRSLIQEIDIDFLPFAKFVQSDMGKVVIENLAEGIEPGAPNVLPEQALRAALVGSATDGSLSLLELVSRYPTSEVVLDWPDIQSLAHDFQATGDFATALGLHQLLSDGLAANLLSVPLSLFAQPASASPSKSNLSPHELLGLQRSLTQLRQELNGVMEVFAE
ncbi:MAG: alpha/beta hydrolase [Synechococcus sp.]